MHFLFLSVCIVFLFYMIARNVVFMLSEIICFMREISIHRSVALAVISNTEY